MRTLGLVIAVLILFWFTSAVLVRRNTLETAWFTWFSGLTWLGVVLIGLYMAIHG